MRKDSFNPGLPCQLLLLRHPKIVYMTLMVKNLSKSYATQHLFSDVSFFVGPNEKVAFVGPNGCGKTTLIRIISGEERADEGEVILPGKNFTLGVLEQFSEFNPDNDVITEACEALSEVRELESRLREFEARMDGADKSEMDSLGAKYAQVLEDYQSLGGYEYEADVRRTLIGIGFSEDDFSKPANVLSGGERTRLALCKLLLRKPNMLILDEPTNHLDLPAVEWFEEYISDYKGGCLIVSHDRFFIDRIADRIIELTVDGIDSYKGGYKDFLAAKRLRLEQQWAAYDKQKERIGKMERFVSRWSADKIRGSQAKDRQKKLDRLDRIEKPREIIPKPKLRIRKPDRSYESVLEVRGLRLAFDGRELFGGINLEVMRGERLALIGRNGEGKTTFLRCITGEIEQDDGESRFGGKVRWGYFSQTHTELSHEYTVLSEYQRFHRDVNEQNARTRLGAFLFSEDDVLKKVGDISGGERSKLALAILVDQEPNVLILDEPTNHLDIPSREALESELEQFPGTIVFVSHDRRFIDRVADKVFEFDGGETELFFGSYTYYHEKKTARLREAREAEAESKARGKKERMEQRKAGKVTTKRIDPSATLLEEKMSGISVIETEIMVLREELLDPEVYADYKLAGEINRRLKELQEQLRREENELEKLL